MKTHFLDFREVPKMVAWKLDHSPQSSEHMEGTGEDSHPGDLHEVGTLQSERYLLSPLFIAKYLLLEKLRRMFQK